jgi:hypothetical protein
VVRRSGSYPRGEPRVHVSALADQGPRITVERPEPDRLLITIERRRQRVFSLSLDEAELLDRLLRRELPELTVRRVEPGSDE